MFQYEPFVADLTGLMVSEENNRQTTHSGTLVMVIVYVNPIDINYQAFVNSFPTNVVKTAQIRSWWYDDNTRIVPV
jgi:hypothetical protein